MYPDSKTVERIKKDYPVGTRVELISMDDPHAVDFGMKGTVRIVDDMGTIHVNWDNGRRLGLIVGEDVFNVISKPAEGSDTEC